MVRVKKASICGSKCARMSTCGTGDIVMCERGLA